MTKKVFKGNLTAESKVYDYTEVAGDLIIPNGIKAEFPHMTSVGGYLDASGADTGDLSRVKFNDPANNAAARCRAMLLSAIAKATP